MTDEALIVAGIAEAAASALRNAQELAIAAKVTVPHDRLTALALLERAAREARRAVADIEGVTRDR